MELARDRGMRMLYENIHGKVWKALEEGKEREDPSLVLARADSSSSTALHKATCWRFFATFLVQGKHFSNQIRHYGPLNTEATRQTRRASKRHNSVRVAVVHHGEAFVGPQRYM
ncbi:hypothetical protein E2C01_008507 [Portunus trituberculatus]|uniref:Uncharacterized protein n=1 Tax=Portunus trituberculatus TaxID=210409 RepID=A0A5B7D2K3_PORTR|nr:hypothetical protein [Portunus trituberculatus]